MHVVSHSIYKLHYKLFKNTLTILTQSYKNTLKCFIINIHLIFSNGFLEDQMNSRGVLAECVYHIRNTWNP